ncbi:hypothetical protein A3I95_02865 [Candidatus Nomurabacteria bacterium RIFCSPLOWO2_02_FULL_44_12]|nr:MAG: hypothetical protein A3I95_02865 [Candidatus Nomurabacteria bacterium RIFCSPLOWO2_02_FULL_44_12]
MKESITSLRWYFGLVGVVYILVSGLVVVLLGRSNSLNLLHYSSVASMIVTIIFALGFIYFATALPKYIASGKIHFVQKFLIINFAVGVLLIFWRYAETGSLAYSNLVISALLTWYLYANIKRLSKSQG